MVSRASKGKCGGFSLLELTTAIFIFSVCILAVSGIFLKCLSSARGVYHYRVASEIVQTEIEFLRSREFDELKNCKDASFADAAPALRKLKENVRVLTIEDYKDSAIKKVSASIRWKEGGNTRSVRIVTLIADRHRHILKGK